jgi:predicted Fe-Mo cluster-binding NifX family protein
MKIAVPTNDDRSISGHFGRSAAFLIFEIGDGVIRSRERRENAAHHTHAQGECGHATGDSHAGILSALAGCDVVICGGMGKGAANALKAGGITPVLTTATGPAESAVTDYLSGKLPAAGESICHCSH